MPIVLALDNNQGMHNKQYWINFLKFYPFRYNKHWKLPRRHICDTVYLYYWKCKSKHLLCQIVPGSRQDVYKVKPLSNGRTDGGTQVTVLYASFAIQ